MRDFLRLAMNGVACFLLCLFEIVDRSLVTLDLRELLAQGLSDLVADLADDEAETFADRLACPFSEQAASGTERGRRRLLQVLRVAHLIDDVVVRIPHALVVRAELEDRLVLGIFL